MSTGPTSTGARLPELDGAPLFLLDELPAGDDLLVAGPEGRHAVDVLRLAPGERVRVGDGRGTVAEGEVAARRPRGAAGPRRGPARGPAARAAAGAGAGAAEGRPRPAGRGAGHRARRGPDRAVGGVALRHPLARGPRRQGRGASGGPRRTRRASSPAVRGCPRSPSWPAPARSAASWPRSTSRSCCTSRPARGSPSVDVPARGTVAVVVGPEGGLTDGEVLAFRAAGAEPVRLGPEVLRTSTAGAAALAALSVRTRWV